MAEPGYAVAVEILRQSGWEHMLVVPMVYRGRGVGAMTVCYPDDVRPSGRETRLLSAIADQAALAVENARLLEDANERSAQLAALVTTSAAVASTLDLDGVMDSVLEQVGSIVEYSATSLILLEGEELVIVKARFGDAVARMGAAPIQHRQRLRALVGLHPWRTDTDQ
jgi:GAF domain-containing protein